MFRFMLVSSAFVLVVGSVGLLEGCSASTDAAETSAQTGSLVLPLSSSANGHDYRLSSGYLFVSGPTFSYVDLSVDAPSVSLELQTGHYYVSLNNPALSRDDGTGNFVPVVASLVSSSAVELDIYDGTSSTLSFAFQTDGGLVRVGAGSLDVQVEVTEGGAVCTPFASDCGEGSWCPPTELTGRPRACVAAGAVPVGEPCAGPLECGSDSSCFDFGAGPVCSALCAPASFDAPCSETATCLAAGAEYGVCTPTR